jgi:hypothetical protein
MGTAVTPRETLNERIGAVGKHLVRVTQEPGVVREVDDAELVDLARQGLIHSYNHTDETKSLLDGDVKTVGKWRAAERGDDVVTAPPAITDPPASVGGTDNPKGV